MSTLTLLPSTSSSSSFNPYWNNNSSYLGSPFPTSTTTHLLPESTRNLLPATTHYQSNSYLDPQSIEHPDHHLLLTGTPPPSNHTHHHQQSHLNITNHYPFLSSQDRFSSVPPEENSDSIFHHVDPRLDALHDISTNPASIDDEYAPNHTSMFPYRSSSSPEEPKPTSEELDPLAAPQHPSNPDVARVRSHIAGFRKSAARHYCSRDSDSSFDGNGSSSDSDSSQHFAFSRYAQSPKKRSSLSRSRTAPKKHFNKPTRLSTRHSLRSHVNRRVAPPRQKRNSAPERFTFATSDDDDDQLTRRSSSTFRKSKKVNRTRSTHSSSSTPHHHHQADNSPTPPPRKHHLLQRVQVVIPIESDLISPSYLRRKPSSINPSTRPANESTVPPTQCDRSFDDTSPLTDSQNLLLREPQVHSTEPIHEPGQHQNSPTTNNSCSPVVSPTRKSQSRSLEKAARSPTKSCSPTKSNLSLSAARTVRSVYEVHVHDMKFKSASGQGPQRIPCSNTGLNERSTLKQVAERLKLDMTTSWKMIIGDKVWLSEASLLKRARARPHRRGLLGGLLDGRIVQKDWHLSLQHLGVFPLSNILSDSDPKPLRIQVVRLISFC
ncbi:hypothetical protein VP01_2422g3 [Puccinia sorghi]|uniref:Uncharacterized protein n=1 Tax=Puccinia sorghi TaxID=27349 RepID=A0A0L6V6N4_9BASI|nr:hypothetical protein VP01_2422g3 [Puccinia sorghi]